MKKMIWVVCVVACAGWAGLTAAATTANHDGPYASALFNYEIPDHGRNSDNGYGFQLNLGMPLTHWNLPHSAVEMNYFGTQRTRDIDGKHDYQNALFFDFVQDFGLYGWDKYQYLPDFKPYVLGGVGVVFDDARGQDGAHPGLDVGVGALFPIKFRDWGWAVRTEFRVIGEQNHSSVPSKDFLFDYHLGIGLQIPLDFFGLHLPSAFLPTPVTACSSKVYDAAKGQDVCATDTDGDGVPDFEDKCPGTKPGVTVNAEGCPVAKPGDSDGDGVPNAKDKCPDTPPGVKVDAEGCPVNQVAVFQTVRFKTNSAVLTPAARIRLSEVAKAINEQPGLEVEIDGNTDNTGTAQYNMLLSKQRAESVRQYLISKGVDPSRLTAKGFGETQPVASNDTAAGRSANRRVSFRLIVK